MITIKINLTPNQLRKANHIMFLSQIINYGFFLLLNIIGVSAMKKQAVAMPEQTPAIPAFLGMLLMVSLFLCIGCTILVEVKFRSNMISKYIFAVSGVLWNIVGINVSGFIGAYSACFIIMTMITVYVDLKLTIAVNGILGSFLIFMAVKDIANGTLNMMTCGMPLFTVILIMIGSCLITKLFIEVYKEQVEDINLHSSKQKDLIDSVSVATEQVFEKYDIVMKELEEITDQVDKNRLSMHGIAEGMEATAADIQNQVLSTNEIQSKIQEADLSAGKAENAVQDVLETIVGGLKNGENLISQAQIVDDKTQEMSEITIQLSNRVKDVSGIVATILSISEQTNLLALNASIEAARAGEAGKGFAVVAEQIRTLAEDTKVATSQITDIIHELEGTTQSTHNILEQSIINIHANSEQAAEVNRNFTETGDNMKLLKSLVDEINRDIKTIYDANETIVDSVTQLSAVSEEVTSTAHAGVEGNDTIITRMDWLNDNMNDIFKEITNLKALINITE